MGALLEALLNLYRLSRLVRFGVFIWMGLQTIAIICFVYFVALLFGIETVCVALGTL